MSDELRVLGAARAVVDEIHAVVAKSRRRLHHVVQLLDSAELTCANIREAYGRRQGPERNQFLRFARGSAEETDEHLRENYGDERLDRRVYWRRHNRIAVIVKMLNRLMGE